MSPATVYTCRVTNWPMFRLNVIVLVALGSVYWTGTGPWWGFALLTLSLLLNLVLAVVAISQRVTAGPSGLTVSLGPLGLPRIKVASAKISHAEMITSTTARSGLPWTPKRGWLLTPKTGPALRVWLASGRTLTISMPEPAAALWAMGVAP
ncbi:hypothetical protein GPX89_30785 [Nocardia sp. ET3-3]|uniref:Uncharacterized protein n=1 Tax=Nocardia terrae TaxID=2675851 RepID=A0A7K1V4R7_9NOCA|nr:hypothetical protein [Nocardia terrae]MVU81614.1 hypothetical protein [Nocardia terrae]